LEEKKKQAKSHRTLNSKFQQRYRMKNSRPSQKGGFFFFKYALRPGGPRHRNAAAPGAISLCSMAPAKAAYAATGIFFLLIND
jgi:hypothetical protein